MTPAPRRARLKALAKINASLKVLHKRPDGFHEIRTIFQTISLADTLDIEFTPARHTRIELESNVGINDNIVCRAADATLQAMRISGVVRFRLIKRIAIRAGLGGGSSDAAAVLLSLPALAGGSVPFGTLHSIAARLGSDVPFFLRGGTALGVGRGTELYPLPDPPRLSGLLVIPPVEVSTPEAYSALGRTLTAPSHFINMERFQALSYSWGGDLSPAVWSACAENDFEEHVSSMYPRIATARRRLVRAGAKPALLSGSGSSLFGIFPDREERNRALRCLHKEAVEPFELVSRARYRRMWWASLRGHAQENKWPPQSRYAR